jgi:hypothetical protein
MSPEARQFLSNLRQRGGRKVRVLPAEYRAALADACPILGAEELRARLARLFEELECEAQISLPRSEHLYDRAGAAKLPAWIDLSRDISPRQPLPVNPKTFPWAPELRFACDIADARQIDVLLRIQDFLSKGGRARPMVPAKERSVELFGDEKRLERLKNGPLFSVDRITLDLLRCYAVLPPLVFEALPATNIARPILILENYSTYHSFTLWNRQVNIYEAVFYGHGEAFETAAAGLIEVTRPMNWDGRAFYFGDLDVKGLLIPAAASEALSAAGLCSLLPHLGCYKRLLRRSSEISLPSGASISLPQECRRWLGEEISVQAETWLQRGIRLAQELIGLEELSQHGDKFAFPPREGRTLAA